MNWRALTIAAGLFLLPGSALACGAYPVGTNVSDVVIGLVADGSSRINYTSQGNAGTSRAGMIVYNRTNNTLHVCDGSAWRTLISPGGTTAAGSSGQVQFNASGVLAADSNLFWDNTNKRLGIGTTTPTRMLQVGAYSGTGAEISLGSGTSGLNAIAFGDGATGPNVYRGYVSYNHATDSMEFGTSSAGRMHIDANGNVGIGIANPGAPLEVAGYIFIGKGDAISEGGQLTLKDAVGGGAWEIDNQGVNGSETLRIFRDRAGENVNEYLTLQSPSGNLTIVGQAFKPGGGAWAATSDARLKDVQGAYEHGLESVTRLNTVRYHYKKDNPRNEPFDKAFVGLVAQDVEKVFPEAVSKGEDGYLSLDTTPINFAVINAIKDLKKLTDDLRAENDDLRNLIEQKGREIDTLKNLR